MLNITPLTPPARKGPTKPESMAAPTFGSRCPVSEPHRSPRTAVSKLPSSGQFPDAGLSISPSSPIQPTNTEAALNKLLQASSSSPLKKSSKSDVPPWVTPQERSKGPISLDGCAAQPCSAASSSSKLTAFLLHGAVQRTTVMIAILSSDRGLHGGSRLGVRVCRSTSTL